MVLGIIVTVKGTDDINFYSRYFAPWVGINEDPVSEDFEEENQTFFYKLTI